MSDVLGTASDASDAVFTIKGTPKITVTAPNGSEEWNVGSTERIRWSAEFVLGNVKIELSRDNGSTWTAIAEETINNGSYEWLVTGPDTESARARVTALNGSTSDTSDAVFTIVTPSSISILTPNGHEEWQIGSEQNITWQSVKIEDDVKIELSRDSGQTWEPITDAASNTGSLAWQVSAPASAMALIKISAGDVFDISDDFFSIIEPPEITVTAPNGGEEWTMGTKQTITWTSVNSSGAVRIEMSRDTGATWETVVDSTQDTGEYEWLVSEPASQSCLVKVSDVEKSIWDQSDTIFSIVPPLQPTITVIAPNGGERWPIGLAQKISWFSQDVNGQIKVELSRDNGLTWETLGEAAADSAVFHWTATSPASDSALIRLSANNGTVQDQSDATFVITEKTTITVNSPSGGEKWRIGSAQTISWSSINTSGTVRIQLTRDNGVNWETLTASAQDSGRYNWIVTGPASNTCLISVTDENYAAQGTSQGLFSIVERPTLSLTTPNGGEIWHIGSEGAITWESTNGGSIVKIELSRDNGSTWTQLVPDAVNIGSWTWVVQEPKSEACLIRLTDIQNVLSDKSDAVFQIDDPTGVARINSEVPTSFALLQNYPNPFNPKTRIQYQLPGRADVQLDVYNVQGTKIATLVNEAQAAGTYMLTWSGKDDFGNQMPSGVYFYRISADSYSASKRMMLMK